VFRAIAFLSIPSGRARQVFSNGSPLTIVAFPICYVLPCIQGGIFLGWIGLTTNFLVLVSFSIALVSGWILISRVLVPSPNEEKSDD
jgi:hypothetical protein